MQFPVAAHLRLALLIRFPLFFASLCRCISMLLRTTPLRFFSRPFLAAAIRIPSLRCRCYSLLRYSLLGYSVAVPFCSVPGPAMPPQLGARPFRTVASHSFAFAAPRATQLCLRRVWRFSAFPWLVVAHHCLRMGGEDHFPRVAVHLEASPLHIRSAPCLSIASLLQSYPRHRRDGRITPPVLPGSHT